jgi:hypothetical protein
MAIGKPRVKKTAKQAAKKTTKSAKTRGRPTGMRKAEGAAPVRAYFAKIRPDHRVIGEAIDSLVSKHVPHARRAVKWSSPLWGVEGSGWFMAFGSFKNYTKVNFFKGAALKPAPPEGEGKEMRSVNVPSLADFDKKQMAAWIKQAAARPGWGK